MSVVRLWVEYQDEHGDRYMRPATAGDLAALGLSACHCGHDDPLEVEQAGEDVQAVLGDLRASV